MSKIKKIVIYPDDMSLQGFIMELPQIFTVTGTLLYNGRNTVKSFSISGRTLVVKRYKRPNIVQRIAYSFFKKSKAERAYLYARMMRERGINTPHEIAYIEMYEGLLLSDSFFVSEVCTLPSLNKLLGNGNFDSDAADSLARQLAVMHEKGVMHGDLNLTNILYEKDRDGRFTFWFIDTNRSSFIHPDKDDCLDNLKRLTHDRELMQYVVSRYAEVRGWDVKETVAGVMEKLKDFEYRRAVHGRFKRLFKHQKRVTPSWKTNLKIEDQTGIKTEMAPVTHKEIDTQYDQYISDYFTLREMKRKGFIHRHFISLPLRAKVKLDRKKVIALYNGLNSRELYPLSGGNDLIVSLTSFPSRISTLYLVIYSLLRQETRPDKITLWLSADEFPNGKADLNTQLTELEKYGLEIYFVDGNIRSHKKYYYVFRQFPDSTVITVDDDILYPVETITNLLRLHKEFPGQVCCNVSRRITFSDGKIDPYKKWPKNQEITDNSSPLNVAIGCGGVLYPPHWYDDDLFRMDLFMKHCPYADDLWLKANELRCGIDVAGALNSKIFFKLVEIPGTGRSALQKRNNGRKNLNDMQWGNLDAMWALQKWFKKLDDNA